MTEYSNGQRLRVTRSCCGIVSVGDIVTVISTRRTRNEHNNAFHIWEPIHWNSGEYLAPVETPETATAADYAVGTELRLLPNAKCMEYSQTEGDTPTSGVFFDGEVSRVRVLMKHNKGNYSVRRLDGEGRDAQIVHESFLAPLDAAPVSEPVSTPLERAELAELQRQLTSLRGQLEEAQQRARGARERHELDIALIGETMMEAAADNDMCPVYDEKVEELNRNLHIELPVREKEFYVDFTFTQRIRVMAVDMDAAEEAARESDEYMDSDCLTECEVEVTEDN